MINDGFVGMGRISRNFVMSFFKKPNKTFTARSVRDEDQEKSSEEIVNSDKLNLVKDEPIEINEKADVIQEEEEEEDRPRIKSVIVGKLSFGDDEEEDNVFQVKKSAYSRKIAKQLRREKKRKEKKPKEAQENEASSSASEKPVEISVPEFEESDNFYDPALDPTSTRNIPVHQFKKVLEKGAIPDAKLIYAMKKQRQMAKHIDDIILLTPSAQDLEEMKLKRLGFGSDEFEDSIVNAGNEEDDDDDELDEDHERMNFAVNKEAFEKEKMKENFILVQDEKNDTLIARSGNSDDELERWEEEQIRKGVGLQSATQDLEYGGLKESFYSSRRKHQIPSYLLRKRPFKSKEEIIRKITDLIEHKKLNLENLERELINIKNEIDKSLVNLKVLEDEQPKLKETYQTLQKAVEDKIKKE